MNIYSTDQEVSQHQPYTYLIGWSAHNKWYYGARYGKKCHPSDLWVLYFTSSRHVVKFREQYGEPDVIKVRKTFDTPLACYQWESKVLHRLNAAQDPKWLNRVNGYKNHTLTYPNCDHLKNTISVKDATGSIIRISKDQFDPEQMTGIAKGKTNVIDKSTGKRKQVSLDSLKNDPNICGVAKGTVVVKDTTGNLYRIPLDDPRYVLGEFVNNRALMCYATDASGVEHWIKKTDQRLRFKELKFVRDCLHNSMKRNRGRSDLVTVRDRSGNYFSVLKNHDSLKSGDLVPTSTKMCYVQDQNGAQLWIPFKDKRIGHTLTYVKLCPYNIIPAAKGKGHYMINGVKTRLSYNDPRVISGEAVPYSTRH
jgi:hypothetical protein